MRSVRHRPLIMTLCTVPYKTIGPWVRLYTARQMTFCSKVKLFCCIIDPVRIVIMIAQDMQILNVLWPIIQDHRSHYYQIVTAPLYPKEQPPRHAPHCAGAPTGGPSASTIPGRSSNHHQPYMLAPSSFSSRYSSQAAGYVPEASRPRNIPA